MINNSLIQIKGLIVKLEAKLSKTSNIKSKIEILNELNILRKQLTELLESKYETINAKKKMQITINKLIKLIQQVNLLLMLRLVYYCLDL
jgi:hypothetical protein